MTKLLSFDFGNGRGKWFAVLMALLKGHKEASGDFRHAIAPLSETTWQQATARKGAIPSGYIRVNGTPYAIGDAARRHTISERPKGAARYTDAYYGAALGYALSQAFPQGSDEPIDLLLTHAPADLAYAEDLQAVATRKSAMKRSQRNMWEVESEHGKHTYTIGNVDTLDEPLGGYFQFALTFDGQFRGDAMINYGVGADMQAVHISELDVLMVDAGSYTTDVGVIDKGAVIDNASFRSTRIGGQNVMDNFETALRANNKALFKGVGDLDVRRVEYGLLNGEFRFGATGIPCQQEANDCLSELVNDVLQVIDSAGGVANFDVLLLTGGWSRVIYPSLVERLPNAKIMPVEKDLERMMYANARGGAKYVALMQEV